MAESSIHVIDLTVDDSESEVEESSAVLVDSLESDAESPRSRYVHFICRTGLVYLLYPCTGVRGTQVTLFVIKLILDPGLKIVAWSPKLAGDH